MGTAAHAKFKPLNNSLTYMFFHDNSKLVILSVGEKGGRFLAMRANAANPRYHQQKINKSYNILRLLESVAS
jgi:hypothetical protein